MMATSILLMDEDIDYCQGTAPFPDVALDHWAVQHICFMKERGVITGYNGGEDTGFYRPERVVSRAELVAISPGHCRKYGNWSLREPIVIFFPALGTSMLPPSLFASISSPSIVLLVPIVPHDERR